MSDTLDLATFGVIINTARSAELSSGLISTFGYFFYNAVTGDNDTQIAEKNVNLLIEQFRTQRVAIPGLVRIVAALHQQNEDALYDLGKYRMLDLAVGKNLEELGDIVGLLRTSVDDVYREDIRFQIWVNSSSGQPEVIISALSKIMKCRVLLVESYPKTIIIHILQAFKPLSLNLRLQLRRIAQGGTAIDLRVNNNTQIFAFAGEGLRPPYYYGAGGFGETSNHGYNNETRGGHFTEGVTE